MTEIKVEKRIRSRNNISYPEYCIESISGKEGVLHVLPIKEIFKMHPECAQSSYMHVHNFYQIIWVQNGAGLHFVDSEKYEVYAGSVFLLSPHNAHHYSQKAFQDGYSIAFTPDFLEHIDPTIVENVRNVLFKRNGANLCTVSESTGRKLNAIISQMELEQNSKEPCLSNTFQSSLLMLLIAVIQRECSWPLFANEASRTQSFKVYHAFLAKVEQCFMELHTVKDYADSLGISISLLGKYTREQGQCTPLDVINDRIIAEAKRMLRYTPLHIKEIAHTLGFSDASYFHKFFKRNAGFLPSDFRAAP